MERLERQVETLKSEVKDIEKQVYSLEKISHGRAEQIKSYFRELNSMNSAIGRLEKTILDELKSSQAILKGMIDNDWAIDKAKLDLEQELERKKQELEGQQRAHEIEMKRSRTEMRKELLIKVGGIMLPILTAIATGLSLLIQNFFK